MPVLMIAYHYPPEGSSSGVQRALAFSRYLSEQGRKLVVLTAHPRAYTVRREDQLGDVPEGIVVWRAFALDTGRHLAIRGRYPLFMALPDRWVSWWWGAVFAGLHLVRKHRPEILWSTYPIATAHLVGWTLQRLTGIPWVADFRDSMTEVGYPIDPTRRRAYRWIERKVMERASRVVFTAPGAVRMYQERYPHVDARRFAVIPNGYDEKSFQDVETSAGQSCSRRNGEPLVLLHSGALYPMERDPRCFYEALAQLRRESLVEEGSLRVVLRATGHDAHHRRLIDEAGIGDLVSLEPPVPYRDALREMLDVDGLLLFQASDCNHQIPAKVYEYMRAKKPILALTDPKGDTARVLREAGMNAVVPLDDVGRIVSGIRSFVGAIRTGTAPLASDEHVRAQSRWARGEALVKLLDEVMSEGTAG